MELEGILFKMKNIEILEHYRQREGRSVQITVLPELM